MTQIACLLVVATVFTWLMICKYLHFTVRGGGAYRRDKTTYTGTWTENAGGPYAQGEGRNRGILQ